MSAKSRFLGFKTLVLGGAGFVGSHLTNALVAEGSQVTVLDDFSSGTLQNLEISENCRIVSDPLSVRDTLFREMRRADIVFHLAACDIMRSMHSPETSFKTNAKGTFDVLMAAMPNKPRVVYASSASVYGNPGHLPILESDPINLITVYAATKFAGEGFCRAVFEAYQVPVVTLRYSNIYGPGASAANPYCGVIAKFSRALRDKPPTALEIHGDGYQTRDFTFIDDAIEATLLAAMVPQAVGEVINIGTGIETSINQLAAKMLTLYNLPGPLIHVPHRDIDNVRRRVLNVEKARRILRWQPSTGLDEGLQKV